MAYSTKLSDALHLLVFVATEPDSDLSSTAIAKSLAANPSSVRQLMGRLRRAELITSVTGHARPRLARPAEEISMLDVYRAVDSVDVDLFHFHEHPNPDCPVGKNVHALLDGRLARAQAAMENELRSTTLKNLADELATLR